MSFGFSISDFIAVGQLAFKLYHDCYKIARGAPHEVQLLTDEMKTLSSSLALLQAEAQDPDSILVQAGDDRVRLVNDIVQGIGDTLRELEKAASKYGILVSSSKRKHLWTKLKWSMESSSIDKLRGKLNYHNTCMNLLLTSVGNSSLQRLESSTRALEQGFEEVKSAMYANKPQLQNIAPSISAVNDDVDQAFLSAAFLKNAEEFQSWRTINLDQWIEAGRWWLIRAQIAVYSISERKESPPIAAYTDLMKASWILVDITASHPQTPFAATTTIAEVQSLLAQIKKLFAELSAMNLSIPGSSDFEGQNFRIWESSTIMTGLRPQRSMRNHGEWIVEGDREIQPCMLLVLVQEDATGARLVALNQGGAIVKELSFNEDVLHQDDIFGSTDETNRESSTVAETVRFKVKSDTYISDSKKQPFRDTELTFSAPHDARLFKCVLSGIIVYLHSRLSRHNNIQDLKAFVLLTAIEDGCNDNVATLLQRSRADVSCPGKDDDLPVLSQTLASRYVKSDINERKLWESDEFGDLPSILSWAIQYGQPALVASLMGEFFLTDELKSEHFVVTHKSMIPGSMTPLEFAAYYGHKSLTQLLISRGFDVREKIRQWDDAALYFDNDLDETALHFAADQGHKEIVLILLENGADINARTRLGFSALHKAAEKGHTEVLQMLLDGGADAEARDMSRATDGADINARTEKGVSALHKAAENGHAEALQILLDRGADVEARDVSGATALHAATRQRDVNLVQILLDRGADLVAKTRSGQTALMIAACSRSEATMWLLMSRGASVLEADNQGIDTTHCAMATSESMVSTVLNKACALLRGANSPCLTIREPRRARIFFEVESERFSSLGRRNWHEARLWLDSHHAYIEPSADWPEDISEQHRKAIVILTAMPMFERAIFSIEFTVVHQEGVLDFTIQYEGSVRLQVLNGGFRDSGQMREPSYDSSGVFSKPTVKWKGVELDPNVEIIKDLSPSDASHYAICGDSNARPSLD